MAASKESVNGVIKGKPGARGLAVIVTNDYNSNADLKSLAGTHKDGEAMESALIALNFAVYWEKNVAEDKMKQIIGDVQSLKKKLVGSYLQYIFFIFSGHGSEGDCLVMEDGSFLRVNEELISPLLAKSAKEIGTLPKVFLIDACRGKNPTKTVYVEMPKNASSASKSSKIRFPEEGGYLLGYATIPMHMSYETNSGGWWLSKVAKLLKDKMYLNSIETLFTEVSRQMVLGKNSQQPEVILRLNAHINLEPTGI